jgi:hypothetical protein
MTCRGAVRSRGGCELPGQSLPILDPDDDVLVECFADYW